MLSVNFEIAKTHLLAKPRQTLIAMLGVTFGIGMYILMISFMQGFNEFLEDTLLSSTPDVRIYNDIKTDFSHSILDEISDTSKVLNVIHHPKPKDITPDIKNSSRIIADLKKDERVLGLSPKIISQVFFNEGTIDITGVVNGIDVDGESRLFHFNEIQNLRDH